MDHKLDIVRELEPDDLQKVPSVVGPDGEHPGRVGAGLEVDDREGMIDGVADGIVLDAVLVGAAVYLHITIS